MAVYPPYTRKIILKKCFRTSKIPESCQRSMKNPLATIKQKEANLKITFGSASSFHITPEDSAPQ